MNTPKLIVFDLDLTLWPFRLDKHMRSPFLIKGDKVEDSLGHEANLFSDVICSLNYIKGLNFSIGIASRIEDICGAYQLIHLLDIAKYFTFREVYPGCKTKHFHSLQQKTKLAFEDMIFFDDDWRNVRDVSRLGVISIHVPNGISEEIVRKNIDQNMRFQG